MRKVEAYVNQYDIKQVNVDNYKVRYFMGITLIEFLEGTRFNTHPRVLRGIANLMLLNVMDFTLREDGNNSGVPEDMFKKFQICLLAKKGRGFKETFGEHGLYLIFKTLSKSLKQENI